MLQWPFVGRTEELAVVSDALVAGRPVVIAGTAGVGKSRLAAEATSALPTAECESIAATRSAASIPFGAAAHLVPEAMGRAYSDQTSLLLAISTSLTKRAAGGDGLVVVVDDAHLLDDATAALVHHLAVSTPVRVVITVRSGETPPDPVTALWKDGDAVRLDVQVLGPDDVASLVPRVLGGQVERGALKRLFELTGGNVLLLREVVLDAVATGELAQESGVWLLHRTAATGPRLVELVRARLGGVAADERRVLELVALGEPLELAALDQLVDPGTLERTAATGLLHVHQRQVRLDHPAFAEVLRGSLDGLAGRVRRLELAGVLADTAAARLANLYLDAGDQPPPGILAAAAREANAVCDFDLAARFARLALDAGPNAAAALELGHALCAAGSPAEAEAVLAAIDAASLDQDRQVELAETRALALHWGMARTADAEDVLRRAEGPLDDLHRHYLRAYLGDVLLTAGHISEALAAGLPLLEAGVDDRVRLRALSGAGAALSLAGRAAEARRATEAALPAAMRLADTLPYALGWVIAQQTLALMIDGALTEADTVARTVYNLTVIDDDVEHRGAAATGLGRVALMRGSVHEAVELLREGSALCGRHDVRGYLGWSLGLLAQALGQAGDAQGAANAVADADRHSHPAVRVFRPEIEVGRAWAAAARGELSTARTTLRAAAEQAAGDENVTLETLCLHEAVRLGQPARDVAARLGGLVAASDSRLAAACAAHVGALAAGSGQAIDHAAERFEALGALLLAAEARIEAAEAFRSGGSSGRAAQASHHAVRLADACGGVRTPVLARLDRPVALTLREEEVAALAAQGLANRTIADRLSVSVRTVEGHLNLAYAKLGVHDRDALGYVLGMTPVSAENR